MAIVTLFMYYIIANNAYVTPQIIITIIIINYINTTNTYIYTLSGNIVIIVGDIIIIIIMHVRLLPEAHGVTHTTV